MHFVGVLLQPIEETLDAVPGDAVPILFGIFFPVGRLAVDDDDLSPFFRGASGEQQ